MGKPTCLEICAGGGGQALGLERAGFGPVAPVELHSAVQANAVQPAPGREPDSRPHPAVERALCYPPIRFMGSKFRLLSWLHQVFSDLPFTTALDAFSGSGCVSYLLKGMGKTIIANDFLHFAYRFADALVANPGVRLTQKDIQELTRPVASGKHFCSDTFEGIFFNREDLAFLDRVWTNLDAQPDPWKRSLAIAALCRSALKKQPRGVFTVANDRAQDYDDGRRDLQLAMEDHFRESIRVFHDIVFDDGRSHRAVCGDVFEAPTDVDLVYMDPPYVPRSDDNCYVKRYHFVEGLSVYWQDMELMPNSRVRKIRKKFTPFSYRRTAEEAFDRLFQRFRRSILVLSYSSNGYPDLDRLVETMKRYKTHVEVHRHPHRYHFGTHGGVQLHRAVVTEYLIVGTD